MATRTVYATATDPSLVAGTPYTRSLNSSGADENINISVKKNATDTSYLTMTQSDWGNGIASGSQNYTVVLEITAGDANIYGNVRIARYNNVDVQQTVSTAAGEQNLSSAAEYTFNVNSFDIGTFSAGDYLAVEVDYRNNDNKDPYQVTQSHNTAATNETRLTYEEVTATTPKSDSDTLLPYISDAVTTRLIENSESLAPFITEAIISRALDQLDAIAPQIVDALSELLKAKSDSDTLLPQISESLSVLSRQGIWDSISPQIVDAESLLKLVSKNDSDNITIGYVDVLSNISRSVSDAITVALAEAITRGIGQLDTLLPQIVGSEFVLYGKTGSDSLLPQIVDTESVAKLISKADSDSLLPEIIDAVSNRTFTIADTILTALVEDIGRGISVSDVVIANIVDNGSKETQGAVPKADSDTLLPEITEGISRSFVISETLSPLIAEGIARGFLLSDELPVMLGGVHKVDKVLLLSDDLLVMIGSSEFADTGEGAPKKTGWYMAIRIGL